MLIATAQLVQTVDQQKALDQRKHILYLKVTIICRYIVL